MYNASFYPTPLNVASAMLEGFTPLDLLERSILEPSAGKGIEQLGKEEGGDFSGVLFKSSYFEMRCYKKGTLHLLFRDRKLWERFNLTAADGKNWLPDDVKAREKEKKASNTRADQYGLPLAV